MLSQISAAHIVILGDFNAHNTSCLGLYTTVHAGRAVFDLARANGLSQVFDPPT